MAHVYTIPALLAGAIVEKREQLQRGLFQFTQGGGLRVYPWRSPDRSPYEIMIAEIALKRTTATAAARVYFDLLQAFPSIQHLYNASFDEVATALAPLGLQWQRARAVKDLAKYLIENEAGAVPSTLERLLGVPGLGPYSVRAILSIAYNIPAAVVDSNIERILGRVFQLTLPPRPSPGLLQALADLLLDKEQHRTFNLGMLDLGALVCRPGLPYCEQCPLTNICDYYHATFNRATQATASPLLIQPVLPSSALRRVRKARGISLVELSKLAQVSKLTIIRIEQGRVRPKHTTVSKIAAALGVATEEISGS